MVSRVGRFVLATAVTAAVTAGAEGTPALGASERPNFSGRWRFNEAKSEDAEEKLREAIESLRSGGGKTSADRPSAMRQKMRPLFDVPEEMTITHTEAEIVMLDNDGLLRALRPDGRQRGTDSGEVKTHWDRQALVVETDPADGPRVTETFSMAVEGRELNVDVRVHGRLSVTVRRVYELEREG
jgi:hypothetical protein